MKVYIVTSGEYSDYSICAVFSSKEKAEEYMGGHPDQFNEIDEYDVDSEPARVFKRVWFHHLGMDGRDYYPSEQIIGAENLDLVEIGDRGKGETHHGFERGPKQYGFYTTSQFMGRSLVSAEHAKKLAVEARQKAMREHPDWFLSEEAQK